MYLDILLSFFPSFPYHYSVLSMLRPCCLYHFKPPFEFSVHSLHSCVSSAPFNACESLCWGEIWCVYEAGQRRHFRVPIRPGAACPCL